MRHSNYNSYYTQIVAASCYLQNKQPSQWTVPINHVKRVCLKLRVKPMNALKFVDKWSELINQHREDPENAKIKVTIKDSDYELLTTGGVKEEK